MQTWKLKKSSKKRPVSRGGRVIAGTVAMLILTLVSAAFDFPAAYNQVAKTVSAPTMTETEYRLGLDLQGGTHLVYEADMSDIASDERDAALEGVKDVIERRVNSFGVAEPLVQTTTTGGTYRVIVELAGISDISEAIAQIGETPVLEFKEAGEELDRALTDEEQIELENRQAEDRLLARDVLGRAQRGESFDALVEELSTETGVADTKGVLENLTEDSAQAPIVEAIKARSVYAGLIIPEPIETSEGIQIVKYTGPGAAVEEWELSHLLICTDTSVTCADEGLPEIDALNKINSIKDRVTPENFATVAMETSMGPSAPDGGSLGWIKPGDTVAPFERAAQELAVGEISDVVATDFGYHLIYKSNERETPSYNVQRIVLPLTTEFDIVPPSSPWKNTELSGKHLESAQVQFDPNTGAPFVGIDFNAEGGELFAELTAAHIGEPIAIFLDGGAISTPVVQTAIHGGQAVITGDFTLDEARLLAQRLNAGALPVPVELLSQQTVGPTLGAVSLEKSIQASLIGFALVAAFMLLMYRLPGFIAVIALILYAFLNLAAYRIFGVTISLSGIAGFVLSLGIAVDANVLIIERLKEELKSGRDYSSATREAFARAWSAIRDGNITTLIAAAVLYWFSSSFIRGFALTLSIGVVLSMFTAISVTQLYLRTVLRMKFLQKPWLFGVRERN